MKTILLVEDNPVDVLLMRRALSKLGLESSLQAVSDGQAAIDYLTGEGSYADRRQFPLPDLMVLDLKLPRKNGFEVLRWLRAGNLNPHLPVVVLTSSEQDEDLMQAYSAGANSYLLKTIDSSKLAKIADTIYQYWIGFNRIPQG